MYVQREGLQFSVSNIFLEPGGKASRLYVVIGLSAKGFDLLNAGIERLCAKQKREICDAESKCLEPWSSPGVFACCNGEWMPHDS